MLSPAREDDDEDNHLCIKCNTTIIGLDNYVKHRKEKCGKKYEEKTTFKKDIPPLDSLQPTYSLGADIFFQSLELQSSVKKTNLNRLSPNIPTSKSAPQLNRKVHLASTSELPSISPLDTNLRGEDWIGGHSLRIGNSEDNQIKLINAVASISGTVKKDIPSSSYHIDGYDYKGDDESDEGLDDTDDEEDEELPTGGKWKPPPHHTGGKWRPVSPDNDEWEQDHSHGKWKLIIVPPETQDRDDDYDVPPPGHTKGKWVPGAHEKTEIMQTTLQTKGAVQYWCGPCNRRLGSKAIYEKHLRTNLHMKKVLPENDLEYSGLMKPNIKNLKRAIKPSQQLNENVYQLQKDKSRFGNRNRLPIKKKRKRRPYFVQCSGCKSRVRLRLMGKHLISHYHFRKATSVDKDTYQRLILDNIEAIVHQSPFQCSPCKFYTNWLSNFMQHWFSAEHERKMSSIEGRYWCSFCKFDCENSEEMLQHLSSSDHGEVVAVINRSMPIIIRKRTIFKCTVCKMEFRYNIELKKHSQKSGHNLAITASDKYQGFHKCRYCSVKFKTSSALAAHLKGTHKQRLFFCFVCSQEFESSQEAKRHRQTSEHRITRKMKLKEQGIPVKNLSRKCPDCVDLVLKNVIELKDHIRKVHPHIMKKCPKCGMRFTLSQEVSRHVRSNSCRVQSPDRSSSVLWNCSQCLFTTNSQAECFFHEVLHTNPKKITVHRNEKEKEIFKYACPICPKIFSKTSLREHLKQHTVERPFVCSICGANFTRKTSLLNHFRMEHSVVKKNDETERKEEEKTADSNEKPLSSASLSVKAPHDTNIEEPMTTTHKPDDSVMFAKHEFQCPHDHCNYVAAKTSQLIRHVKTHGEKKYHHHCKLCKFKTDHTSHLKRHMIIHKGIKPYACPHCTFLCGSLENLRKHILKSRIHPGAPLYRCDFCTECSTNLAKDLRSHLIDHHGFDKKHAIDHVKMMLITDT